MRFPLIAGLLAAAALNLAAPSAADAEDYFSVVPRTYKVQVEYWFFDTDYYYWRTVFESSDLQEAQFVYGLLRLAQEDGELNEAAPNEYWRYFAVDVRLITEYHYPRYQPQSTLSLRATALDASRFSLSK